MNLPSLVNFTMRALVSPPWPSATKMSPLGATRTSEGALKVSCAVAGDAGLAERHQHLAVRVELDDGVALAVVLPRPSVTHTLPSRST